MKRISPRVLRQDNGLATTNYATQAPEAHSVPYQPHSRVGGMTLHLYQRHWRGDSPVNYEIPARAVSHSQKLGKRFPNQGHGLICKRKRYQSTARG